MSPLSLLSCGLRDCYKTDAISSLLSENMQSELALNSLVLDCSQLDPHEIPSLSRFLSGNEAISYIETLIIISKPAHGKLRSNKKGTKHVNAPNCDDGHPTLRSFPDKLFRAVTLFISKSVNLHTLVIDSVNIKPDLLPEFAEALSSTKSVMRWLSFKHCALGSKGVRVLGPHISKMSLQVLVFERCGLCDDCCPAISSIIKRQEAILDTLFWNVTLRSHTTAISTIETAKQSEESDFVFSEGLVALSLNGNNITDMGVKYLRSAVHSNHWFLGLNIANNKIGREGISMLVRSLRNNDALHTVLLGGNPGFTVEMAQNASQITSKAPLRLRYMPKGVAILLERWIKLQLSERTGGYILQDISITVTDRRSLGLTQNHENAPQQEMDIMDIHRSHTNDIIDIQNIDHDVKNIFMNEECSLKVIEKNVPQVVGSEMDVRVGTNTVIDKNSNTQQSAEWGTICASETEIPEDNFLSERSWYEEGSDVLNRCSEEQEPYLDNILQWEDESPKVTSPFESAHNIPEIKKSQVNTLVRANVSKQEVDQNPGSTVSVIPEAQEPYKRISPVYVREEVQEGAGHGLGGMTGGWVGGRVEGGVESRVESGVGGRTNGRFLTSKAPSQSDKASHSSTEKKRNRTGDESPSPRHLADSFNFNLRKGSRGGYSKDKGGYTSSPVNAAGQTPQSITPQSAHYSSDRGQKQGQGVEQGQGQGVEQRRGQGRRRRQSQGQEKKQQSPIFLIRSIHSHSESAVRYPSPRHIDDVHDSSDRGSSPNCRHTEERMTSSISSKNKKTLKNSNPKKSKKRIQNDGFNKELLDPPNFLKSHHEALEHAMSSFSDSVKEVTQSLGSVCAQLRDVTSSLSESLTELNKSHTKSPQSTAPPTHTSPTALIPGLSPSSLLFPIPIPIAVGGFGNKFADKLDFEAKKSNSLIPLGETFGRTRGSLMHREKNVSKDNEGKNDMDEYKRNDISGSSGLHRGYYDGIPSVGTVKRSTLQKVHALLGESTDRGSIPSSTMTSSGVSRSQKSGPRTRIKETTTGSTLTTERDDNNNNNNNNTIKNDAIIDGESEIEIRKIESVASQNRINSPLRDSSTSEDTSFNYSKFSRPNLGPQSRSPPPYTDILSGDGDHISQADMIAFIKERLHRKLHAVLRPL